MQAVRTHHSTEPPADVLTWNARFPDPEQERAYRQSRFPFEKAISRILIAVILLQDLVTAPFPHLLQEGAADITLVGGFWLGMVITSALTLISLSFVQTSRSLSICLFAWITILVAWNAGMMFVGPMPGLGTAMIYGISSVVLYVFPLPLRVRCVLGMLVCLAFVVPYVYRVPWDGQSSLDIGVGFLSANFIGAVISQRFSSLGRQEYAARNREREARQSLERASQEIQKLEGLLPICTHCKKIRDERGDWQVVEEYFRQRTEARFSHGICPGCMKTHYDLEASTVTQP